MVQTRHFPPLLHNSSTTGAGYGPKPSSSCPESTVATLRALCPVLSPHREACVEGCACALLACLRDYTVRAEPWTSHADRGDRLDLATEHARETRRLVGLLTAHLSAPVPPRPDVPGAAELTRREIQVLDAVADGLSTVEVAAVLHISVNTARNHVQRILAKLGVHSRLQAVNIAARHGLLERFA